MDTKNEYITELRNDVDQSLPLFPFGAPNQSMVVAKDQVLIKDSDETVLSTLNAEIRLDLVPRPRIHVHIINIEELDNAKRIKLAWMIRSKDIFFLELKNHKKHIKAFVTTSHLSNSKELSLIFSPISEPIVGVGDDDTQMQYVVFHLFNFKNIIANKDSYSKHVNLEADNWIVELKSLADSDNTFKKLRREGGYGLTHVGCLSKKDDTPISGKEARDMLHALYYFFSFTKGAWCNPVCAVGFNSSDRVWELWSSPISNCPQTNFHPGSWFDEHHSEQLENLFPGFMNRWIDENWREAFIEVLYWYLNSNNAPQDIGIILAQTALERLSFEYAVKKRRLINPDSFIKLSASDKFRLLLSSLEIPIEITKYSPELEKLAKKMKWEDAPRAISEIRNSIVHPNSKNQIQFKSAIYETWNLSLWYLEITLLHLCGYSETYRKRVNPILWVGDVEKVPWESKL